MNFQEFIQIVGADVLEKYGEETIQRVLEEAVIDVNDEIRTFGRNIEKSEYENELIRECVIEQAKYIIANGGSVGNMSGYNHITNSFIPLNEIEKRIVSPKVKQKLRNARWNNRGLW